VMGMIMSEKSQTKRKERILSRIAGILYDRAARTARWVMALELASGVILALPAIFHAKPETELPVAFAGVLVLGFSRWLKSISDERFGNAESIRRQALFSDALGWTMSPVELSRLRSLAGPEVADEAEQSPRDPDFFGSEKPLGVLRLAEMTAESAFWTRHLYGIQLRRVSLIFSGVYFLLLLGIVMPTFQAGSSTSAEIHRWAYLFLPIFIGIDFIGRRSRIKTIVEDIYVIERGLEELVNAGALSDIEIMQMVTEYNCLVASGFPTTDRFYLRHKAQIQKAWDAIHQK
jgi:hypothetical protein